MAAFKVYKRRFISLFILALLNGICAANAAAFTTITSQTSNFFQISATKVNWLTNIFGAIYLVLAWFVPFLVQRAGIQAVCSIAMVTMTLGAWLRYAASCVPDIQSDAYITPAYFLLFIGSLCISISQPLLQIIGPTFSELYFAPRSRLTSTMIIALSNPLGQAITALVVPKMVPTHPANREIRLLLLVLAIATLCLSVTVAGIRNRPPSPPSPVCDLPRESTLISWKILLGLHRPPAPDPEEEKAKRRLSRRATITVVRRNSSHQFELEHPIPHIDENIHQQHGMQIEKLGQLSARNRVDFMLLTILFGIFVGAFTSYSTLIEQIYLPYGFDSTQSGLFIAAFVLTGSLCSSILSPILGRFCPGTSVQIVKIFGPLIGLAYAGLIWIVKGKDMGGIFLTNILIGVFSFVSLPIALELAADVTYTAIRPEFPTSILYVSANGVSVLFLVIMDSLRGNADSSPPFEMSRALIFQGGAVLLSSLSIIGLQAKKRRPDIHMM
ncbi:hypothetical protein CROQUDRAFT_38219 [Cronartium quercuum f. sp. fusiforme G11]|uniref:MFS general substrate transporter n=1 Tax=Cronartium quercuum f. sp. fusiforme G11 TaxID=708437 RepID=A0A9P6NUG1_9BASI|nr:hypothetical protein CROQUDRAFT_38219 [Cronartium quercuum f. sp. fusiforme G11]